MDSMVSFKKSIVHITSNPLVPEPFKSQIYTNFRIFHKFAYYTILSPYNYCSLTNSNLNGKHYFNTKISITRKWLSYLPQLAITALFFSTKSHRLNKTLQQNPASLYALSHTYSALFAMFIFTYTLHRNGGTAMGKFYSKCAQQCGSPCIAMGWKTWIKTTWPTILLVSTPAVKVMKSMISAYFAFSKDRDLTDQIVHLAISVLMSFYMTACVSYIYIAVVQCYQLSKDSVKYLKTNRKHLTLDIIVTHYGVLVDVTTKMNNCTANIMLGSLMIGITAFCKYLGALDEVPMANLVEIIIQLVVFILTLALCGESASNFQNISKLISEMWRNKEFDQSEESGVSILLHDMAQNPIGLKAHAFLMTYSFMGTILGTILTYVIIFLQFSYTEKV
ncbi:hypothetical protein Fcan01_20832 [Folsomia candida]|uniref:Gustatory receptor n=1 Tax=Folsomia candida TaxID=158441 RepID=A0A226DHY2_FOLCA|nr:hypothetical protein Fcan01_20832 [Folsomia candida]